MARALPKSIASNKIGRRGVTILQDRFESEGWIFRRQDGDTDFGVDGEIEIVDENYVTGRLVKCQIKASAGIEFDDGETSVQDPAADDSLPRRYQDKADLLGACPPCI
jgi:hypothetical protein